MGEMSIMHWMIVIAVVVLLFGRGKISGLMGDVADGIKSFKRGMREDEVGASTVPSLEPHIERKSILTGPTVERAREQV
jgi:sec-independent protein translocase protein TatA